ncbi:TPA: restriction endonuclease subunit S [Vibrio parahaemolyticus]
MVPNVSLAELLDLSQYGLSVSSVDNGQYPMFKMNNFRNGFMSEEGVDRVNLGETEFEKYRLEYGDILFNRTNSIDLVGKTGIFTLEGDYVFASYLVKLKVNRDVADPFYLNYFMNFDATKLRLRSLATKAVSQANINPTQLKKLLKVPLLPLPEQRKIAKILSTWDKAITTTEKLIETSKQQKKALMQQLLTGKKRLVNPETGKAFEGEWKFSQFNELYKVANNKATQVKSGEYLESGRTPIVDQGKSIVGGYTNNEITYKDLPVIVFGDHTRIVKWVDFEFAQGADGTQVLKSHKSMDEKFAYYVLLNTDIPNLGYSRHMRELKERDFKYPISKVEQQKIASVLTAADKEIEVLEAKLAHFKQEKKALMQQLLTGKRRVKVDEDVAA